MKDEWLKAFHPEKSVCPSLKITNLLNLKCDWYFLVGWEIILLSLRTQLVKMPYWSVGRVARQRSAKPSTAVRIRHRPHIVKDSLIIKGSFFYLRQIEGGAWNYFLFNGGGFFQMLKLQRLNSRKPKIPNLELLG